MLPLFRVRGFVRSLSFDSASAERQTKPRRAVPSLSSRLAYSPLEPRQLLAADAVLEWNQVLLDAIRHDRTPPPVAARAMAIVHTAIHDAVNSIEHCYQLYGKNFVAHPQASVPAAVAGAAERTLVALFPAQHANFEAAFASALAAIPDGIRETQGISAGQHAADQILALRASDGAFASSNYQPGTNPGQWRPTPPNYQPGLLPHWPDVIPFSLEDGDQFRPANPPRLDSLEYATALEQVRQYGSVNSSIRTSDQSDIARIWMGGPGTVTPPGQWNMIANDIATTQNYSLVENARLFALLNTTLADAGIAAWDIKYAADLWRPIDAIRHADLDGNPQTDPDPTWTPYIETPPFPSYVSGHSTFSGAAARLLQRFLGKDAVTFRLQSEFPGVADRTYTSLAAAGDESGMSRIYGGIHYIFDHTAGASTGQQVADWVWEHRPNPETQVTTFQDGNRLIVCGTLEDDHIVLKRLGQSLAVFQNGNEISRFDRNSINHVVISGSAGDDRIEVRHSLNVSAEIFGGAGNDRVHGAKYTNWIYGQAGNDFLCGGATHDVIRGGVGDDNLMGLDILCGGLGDDDLTASHFEDRLIGKAGRDRINWI